MARFMDPFDEMDRVLSAMGSQWRGGRMPLDAFEKDGVIANNQVKHSRSEPSYIVLPIVK